jgi:hypothetical protein
MIFFSFMFFNRSDNVLSTKNHQIDNRFHKRTDVSSWTNDLTEDKANFDNKKLFENDERTNLDNIFVPDNADKIRIDEGVQIEKIKNPNGNESGGFSMSNKSYNLETVIKTKVSAIREEFEILSGSGETLLLSEPKVTHDANNGVLYEERYKQELGFFRTTNRQTNREFELIDNEQKLVKEEIKEETCFNDASKRSMGALLGSAMNLGIKKLENGQVKVIDCAYAGKEVLKAYGYGFAGQIQELKFIENPKFKATGVNLAVAAVNACANAGFRYYEAKKQAEFKGEAQNADNQPIPSDSAKSQPGLEPSAERQSGKNNNQPKVVEILKPLALDTAIDLTANSLPMALKNLSEKLFKNHPKLQQVTKFIGRYGAVGLMLAYQIIISLWKNYKKVKNNEQDVKQAIEEVVIDTTISTMLTGLGVGLAELSTIVVGWIGAAGGLSCFFSILLGVGVAGLISYGAYKAIGWLRNKYRYWRLHCYFDLKMSATDEELRKAYYTKAKTCHPNHPSKKGSHEKFLVLSKNYLELQNLREEKRAEKEKRKLSIEDKMSLTNRIINFINSFYTENLSEESNKEMLSIQNE